MQPTQAAAPVPISPRVFRHMLAIDALLYATLFLRDYHHHGQSLVAHYIGFVIITDLGVLLLPAAKRHWFNVFRLTSALSLLALTVALAVQDLDGDVLALTVTRCALAVLKMVHAGWLIKVSGPWARELRSFPALATAYVRSGNRSERLSLGFLLIAAGGLYFPQLIFWTHDNDGAAGLDAALTGMSAQNALNVFTKMFIFEVLILGAGHKLVMRGIVAALFSVQVALMPEMYYSAPLPLAHFLAEGYLLLLVVVGYQAWGARRSRPSVARSS